MATVLKYVVAGFFLLVPIVVSGQNPLSSEELRTGWEPFVKHEGQTRPDRSEPATLPVATDADRVNRSVPVDGMEHPSFAVETGSSISVPSGENVAAQCRTVRFKFYGKTQNVSVPKAYGTFHPAGCSEEDVALFWEKLSLCNYAAIVDDCLKCRQKYHHNDWAVFEWVQALSVVVFPSNKYCERAIFTVFLMDRMGLGVRLARAGGDIVCLFSCLQNVYGRQFITVGSRPFYLAGPAVPGDELYTYRGRTAGSGRPLDLRISVPMSLGEKDSTFLCSRPSSVFGIPLEIPLNRSLLSFYRTCPQTDPVMYASSEPDVLFSRALNSSLRPFLDGKAPEEAVNQLLAFLQRDFAYKLDQEQFGYEKPFFCEENFAYPYNDCEDRCILFSYLVRSQLGLEVLLVDHGEHLSTAVRIPGDIRGAYVRYNGNKFFICDPSVIGAKAGMTMKGLADKSAKLYILQ